MSKMLFLPYQVTVISVMVTDVNYLSTHFLMIAPIEESVSVRYC